MLALEIEGEYVLDPDSIPGQMPRPVQPGEGQDQQHASQGSVIPDDSRHQDDTGEPAPTIDGNPMGGSGGSGGFRYRRARGGGGSYYGVRSVLKALSWLAHHQDPETGCWHAAKFKQRCETESSGEDKRKGKCTSLDETPDTGLETMDEQVTGLALLAFLTSRYTHDSGEFKGNVKKGIRYLLTIQKDDGSFETQDESPIITHAILTYVLAKDYAMTGAPKLKGPAARAAEYMMSKQRVVEDDTEEGKYRYSGWGRKGEPDKQDIVTTAWVVLAICALREAGIPVAEHWVDGARNLVDSMTRIVDGKHRIVDPLHNGPKPLDEAAGLFIKCITGLDRSEPWVSDVLLHLLDEDNLPLNTPANEIDPMYCLFGSLVASRIGGIFEDLWKEAIEDALDKGMNGQRLEDEEACVYGSWDPHGTARTGGRVWATAVNTTTQAVNRYDELSTPSRVEGYLELKIDDARLRRTFYRSCMAKRIDNIAYLMEVYNPSWEREFVKKQIDILDKYVFNDIVSVSLVPIRQEKIALVSDVVREHLSAVRADVCRFGLETAPTVGIDPAPLPSGKASGHVLFVLDCTGQMETPLSAEQKRALGCSAELRHLIADRMSLAKFELCRLILGLEEGRSFSVLLIGSDIRYMSTSGRGLRLDSIDANSRDWVLKKDASTGLLLDLLCAIKPGATCPPFSLPADLIADDSRIVLIAGSDGVAALVAEALDNCGLAIGLDAVCTGGPALELAKLASRHSGAFVDALNGAVVPQTRPTPETHPDGASEKPARTELDTILERIAAGADSGKLFNTLIDYFERTKLDTQAAIRLVSSMLEYDNRNFETCIRMADFFGTKGHDELAAEYYRRAIDLGSHTPLPYFSLARMLETMGQDRAGHRGHGQTSERERRVVIAHYGSSKESQAAEGMPDAETGQLDQGSRRVRQG